MDIFRIIALVIGLIIVFGTVLYAMYEAGLL